MVNISSTTDYLTYRRRLLEYVVTLGPWEGVSSCVAQDGRIAQTIARRRRTWRAWLPCVSGSGESTRPIWQTAIHTRASGTCTASPLQEKKLLKIWTQTAPYIEEDFLISTSSKDKTRK